MDSYEDCLEHLHDAEGEDNTDPSAPDAPGCFPARAPRASVLESIDFSQETHGAADPSLGNEPTTNPRSVLYPGRMSAFPDTPDEELF